MKIDNVPDPIDVQVGVTLRRTRKMRGCSQAHLATALGITFQQIQKYERGSNRISASILVKAAKKLGVRSSDLLPDEDDLPPPDHNLRVATIPGAAELTDLFAKIETTQGRKAVLKLARLYAAQPPDKAEAVE